MNLEALWRLAKGRRMATLRALGSVMTEYTRACFLVSAAHAGALRELADGPLSLESLGARLGGDAVVLPQLSAWLDVGVSLRELGHGPRGYTLEGRLARALASPEHDDLLAMLEELTSLHQRLVFESPRLALEHTRLSLADQSGAVVARSSRLAEPFVQAAISSVVPSRGSFRVLEIGCGSGTYLRFMAERNPELQALGLELQPEVAEQARRNLETWRVSERVKVSLEDVRQHRPVDRFDLVTLHNNVYYFPVEERVALFRQLREFLVPGGKLLITTATRGGSPSVAVLNLWAQMTEGCGPLPLAEELTQQLELAGFVDCRAENLAAPVDRFHAFVALRR